MLAKMAEYHFPTYRAPFTHPDVAKPLVGPPFASHKEGKHVFLNLVTLGAGYRVKYRKTNLNNC